MNTTSLSLFLFAALMIAVVPGPGIFYVAARTLSGGRRAGFASTIGTGLGGLVHVMAGAVGVSAIILASAELFAALKLIGAFYLVWLGFRTFRDAGRLTPDRLAIPAPEQAFRDGVLVEALNPKTAAFFLAFIPQFIDPATGQPALHFIALGVISVTLNTSADARVVEVEMRGHQSGDFPGVRSRQVVTAAANDAKLRTGQQLTQSLADGKRADQVSIAPDQQARYIDRGQFDRQIRAGLARFGDPGGSIGKFTPIICAPIRPAQIMHRDAAGSHGQDKPADPVRSRKRHAQRDEPAQGLSDQVRRSVEFGENHRYQIVQALNPRIMGLVPEPRPREKMPRPIGIEPVGHGTPERSTRPGTRQEQHSCHAASSR